MAKVRLGIIGIGGMGIAHCKVAREIEEVELAAVSDVDPKRVGEAAVEFNVTGFTDYKELIDSGLVDAVIVAAPHFFHPPIGIYALEKGLHVLVEKPLAVTVADADRLIAAATSRPGQIFCVMFQARALPQLRAAKKLITDGRLGEIYRTQLIAAWCRTQAYYNSASWRATWKTEGGGVLINQAPHSLDSFTWLAGLPAQVTATTLTRRHKIEVEDEVHALLEYPNGAIGYLYTSVNEAPTQDRIEILGDKGKLVIENAVCRFAALQTPVQEYLDKSEEIWGTPAHAWEDINPAPAETGPKAVIRNFARAISLGEPLIIPGPEGLNSLELANALLLSGKTGQAVSLPVSRPEFTALFNELVAHSIPRKVAVEKRVTDTKWKPT